MEKLKFDSFDKFEKRMLKDKRVKKDYDDLGPEFEMIASLIKKRLEKRMTQAQLAKKLGTKQSAVARLEGGTYNPSFKFLQKVATALGAKLQVIIS